MTRNPTSGGTVKCWGYNAYGQLGDGTTTNRSSPTDVPGLSSVVAIYATYYHTCALISGGTVKCWGWNVYGQLGDGTTTNRSSPTDVPGLVSITAIATGGYHTCALISGGTAKCWGQNTYGQLGDGTTTNRTSPTDVTGLSAVIDISATFSASCALISGGTVKCWGNQILAELGLGFESTTPQSTPTDVPGLANVTSIVGSSHTCALFSGGSAKCWGISHFGQLGDGDFGPGVHLIPGFVVTVQPASRV